MKRKMEVMTNMEAFQIFAEDNMWRQIWPELSLVLGAVLVLLVDLFGSKGSPYFYRTVLIGADRR